MYINVPRIETTDMITNMLKINVGINKNSQQEIIHILEKIMEQNYFHFKQKYYKQTDGLALGAPTSAVISEAYIQIIEHKQMYPILIKHQITRYFLYVDDILLIYDQTKTNID
jgi:hypothetical protein